MTRKEFMAQVHRDYRLQVQYEQLKKFTTEFHVVKKEYTNVCR